MLPQMRMALHVIQGKPQQLALAFQPFANFFEDLRGFLGQLGARIAVGLRYRLGLVGAGSLLSSMASSGSGSSFR